MFEKDCVPMSFTGNTMMIISELRRPWKLFTFAVGLSLLIAGSFFYKAPDWDIPVSVIMAGFDYLTASWSMHVIAGRRWRCWPLMIVTTWWCVDGCYALYRSFVNPEALAFMREANWPASISLYWTCGIVWYFNGSLGDLLASCAELTRQRK